MLINRLIHRSPRLAATLLCVACVPLVTMVLVRWLFGTPLSAFRPVLSDDSRYLLVDDSTLGSFKRPPRVDKIATLPYGNLYRYRDAIAVMA